MSEPRFVIRIEAMPNGRDQRDLLELILAAVALEVRARVVINAAALDLFVTPSAKGWRQLIEQDLIEVLVVDPPAGCGLHEGVGCLNSADLEKLLAASTVITV